MSGFIFAIIAGVAMSFQGVFNTRLGEKIGSWPTNIIVQGTGLIFAVLAFFIFGGGDFKNLSSANKLYLSGGLIGVIIIYTVMSSIEALSPTVAISTILVAQLLSAAIIDCFGFFDTKKVCISANEIFGIGIMVVGIIVFKYLKF